MAKISKNPWFLGIFAILVSAETKMAKISKNPRFLEILAILAFS